MAMDLVCQVDLVIVPQITLEPIATFYVIHKLTVHLMEHVLIQEFVFVLVLIREKPVLIMIALCYLIHVEIVWNIPTFVLGAKTKICVYLPLLLVIKHLPLVKVKFYI